MKRMVWAALLAGVLACLDTSVGPAAGLLKVNLTTPNTSGDGAILLTVSGPTALASARPETGLRLFAQSLGATNHFALTGTLASGTVLTIGVPDVSRAAAYTATIQQVAASNYQLRALAGYSLTVAP